MHFCFAWERRRPGCTYNQPPAGERSAAAVAVMQKAVAALGGSPGSEPSGSITLTGTLTAPDGTVTQFTLVRSGRQFRDEYTSSGHQDVVASGNGHPASERDGITHPLNYHIARARLPYDVPLLVLSREVANVKWSIEPGGTAPAGEAAVRVVDTSDRIGRLVTPQVWYFSSATGLPVKVKFRIPSNNDASQYFHGSITYSGFSLAGGWVVPERMTETMQGRTLYTIAVTSAQGGAAKDSSEFDLPGGGQ